MQHFLLSYMLLNSMGVFLCVFTCMYVPYSSLVTLAFICDQLGVWTISGSLQNVQYIQAKNTDLVTNTEIWHGLNFKCTSYYEWQHLRLDLDLF